MWLFWRPGFAQLKRPSLPRFRSGPLHTEDMAVTVNPGAGERAARALLRDPARRNVAIASEAGCGSDTIARLRAQLEQRGVIRPARMPYPTRNQGAYQRASAQLKRNPARSVRAIAEAAGCTHPTVIRARRELERAATARAEAAMYRLSGLVLRPCQPWAYPGLEFGRGWPRESPSAIALCLNYCADLARCRAEALALSPGPGVLGGMTQRQRQAARLA
jgi:hypothetical protein